MSLLFRKYCLLLAVLLAAFSGIAQVYTLETIPDVKKRDANAYVCNPDGILSSSVEQELNQALKSLETATSVEVDIVVVTSVGEVDLDLFANQLFAKWGTGKRDKDNGLLILFVLDERFLRIETGYGLEGVLPDMVCNRIMRNTMFPKFKEGDYDQGIMLGMAEIIRILTDPAAADEVRSEATRNSYDTNLFYNAGGFGVNKMFIWGYGVLNLVLLLVYLVYFGKKVNVKNKSNYQIYQSLNSATSLIGCLVFLFPLALIPLFFWLKSKRKRLRFTPIPCSVCGRMMVRLSDKEEQAHLTQSQKLEQKLKSIDYDVWYCSSCAKAYNFPYFNLRSKYTPCPKCAVRAYGLKSNVVLVRATTRQSGQGVRTYLCQSCNHTTKQTYTIPRVQTSSGSSRGGGFGGSSGGGGSRGGGRSGGGGSSGRW